MFPNTRAKRVWRHHRGLAEASDSDDGCGGGTGVGGERTTLWDEDWDADVFGDLEGAAECDAVVDAAFAALSTCGGEGVAGVAS